MEKEMGFEFEFDSEVGIKMMVRRNSAGLVPCDLLLLWAPAEDPLGLPTMDGSLI